MGDDDIRSRLLHLRNLEALNDLEDEVLALRIKVAAMEAREKGYINTESQLTFVAARNVELERMVVSSMQDATKTSEDRDRLAKRLAKVQADANDVNAQLVALQETHAASVEASDTDVAALKTQLADSKAKISCLEERVTNLDVRVEELEASELDLQRRLEASEASTSSLRNVNDQVCYQLAATKHDLEAITRENEKLAGRLATLETQLQELSAQPPVPDVGQPSAPVRCKLCTETETQLALATKQLIEMTHQRDRLDGDLQDCKVRAETTKCLVTQLQRDLAMADAHSTNLAAKVDSLEAYVQDVEASTTFEKYMAMKNENRCLSQRTSRHGFPSPPVCSASN
ncbi:hypothetical protein SDRG_13195 [Saprolegnia diclina VS20]|uniref:Uncharacterized protein n=1 Tax=Saprolegnia diclina (strain VS20) TaxID=1156394 RepID=T0PU58_SAPDV|nr:hypothetical protein SDRG_13195 [Saprolegnia diclina VS20]EQC29039.1 hypothetical protein SDRG_13195 [Saprolegnia diclina VS20]|eukprot:XP_008617498.1 hypothetical protein SDRG_13195 [Saprolegnia diclina VS20]